MKIRLVLALVLLASPGLARPADSSDDSLYTVIRGAFVIEGYEPDGDSVRFIADTLADWNTLENFKSIQKQFLETDSNQNQTNPNKKNSVQLRFEGTDTPEFGNAGMRQPFGQTARDFTLAWLGFERIVFTEKGKQVRSASPERIRGVLLSKAAIGGTNGRPIVYVFRESDWKIEANKTKIEPVWLEKSLNMKLIQAGMAYPEFYNTMPPSHRGYFQTAIRQAQAKRTGIWQIDQSQGFSIATPEAVREAGALIFPKIYRRLENYFEAVKDKKTALTFLEYLRQGKGIENDDIRVLGQEINLSDVLEQKGNCLSLKADPNEIIFY